MKLSRVLDIESAEATHLIADFCVDADYLQCGKKQPRLLARALMRELLHDMTQSATWTLHTTKNGKPYVLDAQGAPGPHVSFSHTGSMAVAAIDLTHPVGVDIERWQAREVNALAAYAFGPREIAEVTRQGESAFYRIWTIREAIGKASGEGIFAQINGTDTVSDFQSPLYEQDGWKIHYHEGNNYSLALAQQV